MKRTAGKCFIFVLVLVGSFLSSKWVNAAIIQSPTVGSQDERVVEESRDDAILNALVSIDPSVIPQSDQTALSGELGPDHDLVMQKVNHLREMRKQQFKYLTWSHIRSVITPEAVLAKEEFLTQRGKNLETVLTRAIDVHLPAQIKKERILLAKYRIAKAVRDFFPELSIDSDIKSGDLSRSSFLSDNWRMSFRQPLFRGGVLWNTLLLELSNLEIAKREHDQSISDLVADVSKAYFEYERARNVLKDQETLFEKVKVQQSISNQKYEEKLISEIEKLNADSLYSQAQYDLETAQQELEIAMLELQKFLKLESEDKIDTSPLYDLGHFNLDALKSSSIPSGENGAVSDNDLDRLVDMAYEYRPDLEVEASKLKGAQLAFRVALGRRLPQIDMILEFGELAEAFIDDLPSKHRPHHRHEFRVGMELTWPFAGNTMKYTYDHDQRAPSVSQFLSASGTRTRTNTLSMGVLDDLDQFSSMTEAKINNLEQVVELEKTEREVVREVKEAYFNFKKSLIQVESAYKRMGYRERLARLAEHRLGQNEVQVSEYLQAELDYVEERGLVYKALSDFFLSKAQLNKAIGVRDYLEVEMLS
ncbi:MAG: hypothetical protein A3A73_04365 [Omnitrophica bacterium RIFCSPLOWO2_01_FULL_50_24]|nr:MAG: hypothetical protein A3A73_04365 [Omnitrophica bacterium RIFCSPLOWO2_01_FULL_50_24]